jgi:hypothetical protein
MSDPHATRPYMPGNGIVGPDEGHGLLPWSWADDAIPWTASGVWRTAYLNHALPQSTRFLPGVRPLRLQGLTALPPPLKR